MNINSRTSKINFTGFASGDIASFTGLRAAPLKISADINPIQSGSGDPSPDNIRPIIGASECNVVRCGKNVWSYGDVSGTQRKAVTVDIKAGTYTVSANVTSSDTDYDVNLMLFYYEDNATESVYINRGTRQSINVTLSKNVKSIIFYASRGNKDSVGDTFSFTDIQLEVGSTATAYEAYTGNTYTIQLGDTYYGGSLDVTNGVLTVDREFEDFDGTENWVNVGEQYPYAFQLDTYIPNIKSSHIPSQNIICNMFKQANVEVPTGDAIRWQVNTKTGRLYVYCHRYSGDLAGFKAMLAENNLQVCYSLATPITVQLSPTQIEQLLGANNIFSDTGNVAVYYVTI